MVVVAPSSTRCRTSSGPSTRCRRGDSSSTRRPTSTTSWARSAARVRPSPSPNPNQARCAACSSVVLARRALTPARGTSPDGRRRIDRNAVSVWRGTSPDA
eukprot:scaffold37840_cov58-Phaeocystis_antarctica.AAC.8